MYTGLSSMANSRLFCHHFSDPLPFDQDNSSVISANGFS